MEKYETLKAVGDGSFGSVMKARNKLTNEIVAIKRMKAQFASWDEAMKLREVKSLRKLNHHNVVKLKEVIRQKDSLFFVFEFMEKNLYEIISKNVSAPTESEIQLMTFDSLHGISQCHKSGYFHRDLKPENLLINSMNVVKLADFGLAREIRSRPPLTEYVSTRWYRAPELLLSSTSYNSPIDIFAMGCILAEMYLLRPLAPGNSEADQLMKLCLVLGTPPADWTEGYQLATNRRMEFPKCPLTPLTTIIPNASSDAIDLIRQMLQWDPSKRPTAQQCLQHPFFSSETRAEYQRRQNVSMQQAKEDNRRASDGAVGFMQLRNSQNKGLQQKQLSSSVISPLTSNASMSVINQDQSAILRIPSINFDPNRGYGSDQSSAGPYGNGLLKRESGGFKSGSLATTTDQSLKSQAGMNYRNIKSGITGNLQSQNQQTPLSSVSPNKPLWEGGQQQQASEVYGTNGGFLRNSNSNFVVGESSGSHSQNQNNNRAGHGGGAIQSSLLTPGSSKIMIAPKLNGNLLKQGGLGQSSGIGSSSILNLPVLGQENMLQPTNRGLRATDSTKQFLRGEESKVLSNDQYKNGGVGGGKNPSYFSRSNNMSDNDPTFSPGKKDNNGPLGQGSRNLSVLNIKKSSARFLSPLQQNGPDLGPLPMNNKMPASTVIDKYPGGVKPTTLESSAMPRALRENKNNQMFEKYMHRHNHNRKASMEMGGSVSNMIADSQADRIGGAASGFSDFALPSLGMPSSKPDVAAAYKPSPPAIGGAPPISQLSGRQGQKPSNFSSRNRRNEPAQASISDDEFDL